MSKKAKASKALLGADEFGVSDATTEAIDKITAAKAAAAAEEGKNKAGHNNGPIMDREAYRRAGTQLLAEQIELDNLATQAAEIRGRISSIRKIAKKENVDWTVVKKFVESERRVMKGETGAMVTELRKLGEMMRIMGSPLGTQWNLFPEMPGTAEAGETDATTSSMDAELQGQHAYSNGEPLTNNPKIPGTQEHVDWAHGWKQAQAAKARSMAPKGSSGVH
jgi:hypothetical protein